MIRNWDSKIGISNEFRDKICDDKIVKQASGKKFYFAILSEKIINFQQV